MLKTEKRNPKTAHIDRMDTLSQLKLMNEENMNSVKSVGAALDSIAAAIDEICKAFEAGGRLFYIGAGTSGRLGVADAAECPPTFGISYDRVIGIMAGGDGSFRKASENAEDNETAGVDELKKYGLCGNDTVVGISASGTAAFVVKAIEYANGTGCITVGITSNADSALFNAAQFPIFTDTGAEVITGSTRLKAGTAQKLVLNMISTVLFIRCGYVYENMMVNLKPSNIKLKARMVETVREILHCSEPEAVRKLDENGWSIPRAVRGTDERR